jgi:hypothetical protein
VPNESSATRRSILTSTAAGFLAGTGAAVLGSASPAAAATAVTPDWVNVLTWGADPTGTADSTSAITTSISKLPSAGGVIYFPAGTYKISTTITCEKVPTYFVGDGPWASTIAFYGSQDCFHIFDPTTYSTRTKYAGGFRGITIDGSHTTGAATALHIGDLLQYDLDVAVQNFTKSGSMGVHLDNAYYWTEQLHGRIYAQNCASHVVFDATGTANTASGSFERCDLDIYIDQEDANFDGVVFQNGAFTGNGSLRIRGNFAGTSAAVSSAVLRLTGSRPSSYTYNGPSGIVNGLIDVGVECGSGSYTPKTIIFGSAANSISSCYGALNFGIGGDNKFSESNNAGNLFNFQGLTVGDASLPGPWISYPPTATDWSGQVSCRIMPSGNEVMVTWAIAIAAKTPVTGGTTVATLASKFAYPHDNKVVAANLSGGGLSVDTHAPAYIAPDGAFVYRGPSFTPSSNAYWYGQGIYTLSL